MAWLVGDGFDFYAGAGVFINPYIWQGAVQCTLSSSVRFPPGIGLQLGNTSVTAGNATTQQFANSQTIFVNANIISGGNAHVNGGTTRTIGFTLRDTASNIQCGFYLRNGGDFVLTTSSLAGGSVLATSPVLMPLAGQWAHIQVKIFISNTAGTVELHLNGQVAANWTATGLNTRNGSANFYANVINWESNSAAGEVVDDFYAFNDQAPAPNTFQGDVHAVRQLPTSDIAINWARNTGPNNCLAVDDTQDDGDSTYVSTLTVNATDTYGMAPLSPTPNTIICVQPRYEARMDDAGPHTMNAQLTSGGTTVNLPTMNVASTYAVASQAFPQDPNTGLAWTPAAVNACLLGIKLLT